MTPGDGKFPAIRLSHHDQRVVEAVCADDREWFEKNPLRTERIREVVPGEWMLPPPPEGHTWIVSVVNVGHGARTRMFDYFPDSDLPSPGELDSIQSPL